MCKKISIFLIFVFSFSLLFASRRSSGQLVFSNSRIDLFNVKANYDSNRNVLYSLSDTGFAQSSDKFITDTAITFNEKDAFLKDHTGRYRVKYSSYNFIQNKGSFGKGAAYFFKREHYVKLETRKGVWMNNTNDLGSFTVEFRFNPLRLNNSAVLFSRVGYMSGQRNGIEIKFQNGQIQSDLYNIFTNVGGEKFSFKLKSNKKLRLNKWCHYILSYDRNTGKIYQRIDDVEQDRVYATADYTHDGELLVPSFASNDIIPVTLAYNYTGYMDEFRILFENYEDIKDIVDFAAKPYRDLRLNNRIPRNREGVISGSVHKFDFTGTMISLFGWDEVLEKDTFVWGEFRMSDSKFDKDNQTLKWYRIKNNQRNIYLKEVNGNYLRGKYFQWRIHLVSSPDGKFSPKIKNIKVKYELDFPPIPPVFAEVTKTGPKYVILRWKKNVDHDIAGYKVYYGTKSGEMQGVITTVGGKRITNASSNSNYVEIKIDSNLIEENKIKTQHGMLEYPIIKNNILYYFKVTAYDSYKVDTKFNHESKFSNVAKGRPFAGSEI